MNTITIKWMAFIAIALLILGTFSPVLQVRAQADDRRRDGDGNEATEPVLTEEEAIVLALEFLRAEIGNNEFVVEKVQVDDGNYELKISDSDSRYEITLDGKTGEILDFEVKTDDDEDEDEEEANASSITPIIGEDDAISAAVEALPGPFEEGVDVVERIQINDDGNYNLLISSSASLLDFKLYDLALSVYHDLIRALSICNLEFVISVIKFDLFNYEVFIGILCRRICECSYYRLLCTNCRSIFPYELWLDFSPIFVELCDLSISCIYIEFKLIPFH